jgi:hypothetical protein
MSTRIWAWKCVSMIAWGFSFWKTGRANFLRLLFHFCWGKFYMRIKFSCKGPGCARASAKWSLAWSLDILDEKGIHAEDMHPSPSCFWGVPSRLSVLRMLLVEMRFTISSMSSSTWVVRHRCGRLHFTCGTAPVCPIPWHTLLDTCLSDTLRSGNRRRYSSTAAHALPSQKPYTYKMSAYSLFENVVTEPSGCFFGTLKQNITASINRLTKLHTTRILAVNCKKMCFFGCIKLWNGLLYYLCLPEPFEPKWLQELVFLLRMSCFGTSCNLWKSLQVLGRRTETNICDYWGCCETTVSGNLCVFLRKNETTYLQLSYSWRQLRPCFCSAVIVILGVNTSLG